MSLGGGGRHGAGRFHPISVMPLFLEAKHSDPQVCHSLFSPNLLAPKETIPLLPETLSF